MSALILIVDDDWMNLEIVETYLLMAGYRVNTAHNGGNALQMTLIEPPDLVLLDVMLPDINGNEVCRRLKQDKRTSDIPVLMLTALQTHEDREHSLDAGADGFISKPFIAELMITQIEDLLAAKRQ
jgi:DNA-binding response OmpR family regulator